VLATFHIVGWHWERFDFDVGRFRFRFLFLFSDKMVGSRKGCAKRSKIPGWFARLSRMIVEGHGDSNASAQEQKVLFVDIY
jgi:hypothetical protein